jgi:hypothetical protein
VSAPTALDELGLTVNGTVALNRWLGLRGMVLLRGGLEGGEASIPWGVAANVFLVGTY